MFCPLSALPTSLCVRLSSPWPLQVIHKSYEMRMPGSCGLGQSVVCAAPPGAGPRLEFGRAIHCAQSVRRPRRNCACRRGAAEDSIRVGRGPAGLAPAYGRPMRQHMRVRSVTAQRLYCLLPGPCCLLPSIHLSGPTVAIPPTGQADGVGSPHRDWPRHPGQPRGRCKRPRRPVHPGPSTCLGAARRKRAPSTLTPRAAFLRAKPSPKRLLPP